MENIGYLKILDQFLMHVRLSKSIIDARPIPGDPASDHDPIILKLQFKKKRRGIGAPKSTKVRITWDNLDNPKIAIEFDQMAMANLRELRSKGIPSVKAFLKAIVRAVEQTCAKEMAVKKGC
jgi:hypothetical protein